jgi:hypothetical protein
LRYHDKYSVPRRDEVEVYALSENGQDFLMVKVYDQSEVTLELVQGLLEESPKGSFIEIEQAFDYDGYEDGYLVKVLHKVKESDDEYLVKLLQAESHVCEVSTAQKLEDYCLNDLNLGISNYQSRCIIDFINGLRVEEKGER